MPKRHPKFKRYAKIGIEGRKWILIIVVFLICALSGLYLSYTVLLKHIGNFLIVNHDIQKSDCIVVIGGGYGNRIAAGVRLFKEGRSNWLVVTGPLIMRDYFFKGYLPCTPSWAGLMKSYALDHGIPESQIISIESNAESTKDEAEIITEFLVTKEWKSAILVTSNYHTRRAYSIFSKYAHKKNLSFYTFAAADPIFFPDKWWTCRHAVKTLFYEYTKLLFYMIEY